MGGGSGGAACSADFGARGGRPRRGVLLEPPLRTRGIFFFPSSSLSPLFLCVSSQSCSPVLLSLLCFSPGAIVADCDSATLPGTGGSVRFSFEDHNATSVATTGRPAARAPFVAVARIPGTGLVSKRKTQRFFGQKKKPTFFCVKKKKKKKKKK